MHALQCATSESLPSLPLEFATVRRHPERSRSSGGVKDLLNAKPAGRSLPPPELRLRSGWRLE